MPHVAGQPHRTVGERAARLRRQRSSLPPIPREVVRDTRNQHKLQASANLLQNVQRGGLRPAPTPTGDALNDSLARLAFAHDAPGHNPQDIDKALKEVMGVAPQPQDEGGFLNSLFSTLEKVALPFEAFSEGVNALIGPLVPQDAFRERSGRSREIIADLFGGNISGADAAGLLREVHRERSTVEQLITGFLFDPINLILPGASAIKTGVRGGVMAGTRAGGRTFVDTALPYFGPKIRRRLSNRDVVAAVEEASNTTVVRSADT